MEEIKNYPELVDTIWKFVQGTPEERERVDFVFSEREIVASLGIPYSWDSAACVYGVAQAIDDLVSLEYCTGRANYNGHRWSLISPSPNCSDMFPSEKLLAPPIANLLPLRSRALQFFHEQTLCHEENITFYVQGTRIQIEDAVQILLPTQGETEKFSARGQVIEAIRDLKQQDFIRGIITTGNFGISITLKGACWLQTGLPLLNLLERTRQLTSYPETADAAILLMRAYSEDESKASPTLYIAIEKLENAAGGERGLIELLNRPKTFIGDIKQSLQSHRHASTNANTKFNHQQCLARAKEIIEVYVTQREQGIQSKEHEK